MNNKQTIKTLSKKLETLSAEEIEHFFQAFFTEKERSTLEGRMNIINQLLQGIPQRKIAQDLGLSFSQITRGSHELKNGVGKTFFPKFFATKKH